MVYIGNFDELKFPLHALVNKKELPEKEKVNKLRKLLSGSNINQQVDDNDWRMTVLHVAVLAKLPHVVNLLVERKADLNITNSDGSTALHMAADNGSIDIALALVRAGAHLNITNSGGSTALHMAAYNGSIDIALALVKAGAHLNITNQWGLTALDEAARSGHTNIVQALNNLYKKKFPLHALVYNDELSEDEKVDKLGELLSDSNINQQEERLNMTLLHLAVELKLPHVVNLLVASGANLNITTTSTNLDLGGYTALHIAARRGFTDIVQAMVEAGADINITNSHGSTALHVAAGIGDSSSQYLYNAAANSSTDIVLALIEAGTNLNIINSNGSTVLHHAAEIGSTVIVLALVKAGADLNITDVKGWTALHWAAFNGSTAIALALMEAGDDLNITDSENGWTALHWAASKGDTAMVQALGEAGADLNITDSNGSTALHVAARNGSTSMVQALVKAGADLNISNSDGSTALLLAVDSGENAISLTLVEAGSDLNIATSDGMTALHFAAKYSTAMVLALVKAGADVYLVNRAGETAIDLAVELNHLGNARILAKSMGFSHQTVLKIVKRDDENIVKLLSEGNNISADKNDWTALHCSAKCGAIAVTKALVDLGAKIHLVNIDGETALDLALKNEKQAIVAFLGNLLSQEIKSCADDQNALKQLLPKASLEKSVIDTINAVVERKIVDNKENKEDWLVTIEEGLSKRVIEAFTYFDINAINLVQNNLHEEIQHHLFVKKMVHHEEITAGGRTLIQVMAEKDDMAKQHIDFINMMTNLEKKFGDCNVDKVIAQLKEGMESSSHLVGFIDKIKDKFPITPTKKVIMMVCNFFTMIYLLTAYLSDITTDSLLTHKFHSYSKMPNASSEVNSSLLILQLHESIELCENSTSRQDFLNCFENIKTENDNLDQNQFGKKDWSNLFLISVSHLILPWIMFFSVSLYLELKKTPIEAKTCLSKLSNVCRIIFNIFLFPFSIFGEKFILENKLVKLMAKKETESNKKDEIKTALEENEKKETLMTTIEVTSESSFQLFLQMMLTLPYILTGTITAYRSETWSSFGQQIVTLQTISILTSFIFMARSYYRIRNLSKKNALSGKSAITIFFLTTLETMSRILSFGIFLYLASDNLNLTLALGVYYSHVSIMLVFNFLFNQKAPEFSFPYLIDIFFNSLSSTYSYMYYNYAKLLRKEDDQKHQPSLIRQVIFYIIFLGETVILTCLSLSFFEDKAIDGKVNISDGLGGHFPIARGNLHTVIVIIWGFQLLALILRLVFYGMHPSSVSMTDIMAKNQISILGQKVSLKWCCQCTSKTMNKKIKKIFTWCTCRTEYEIVEKQENVEKQVMNPSEDEMVVLGTSSLRQTLLRIEDEKAEEYEEIPL